MAKYLFETTVKCSVWVEADTAEEAAVNVEDLDPLADYCDQYMDQEWELTETDEEEDDEEPLGSLKNDRRHGGPYDRGSADAYYRRPYNPHYYKGNTGMSDRVEEDSMTPEEIEAYKAGYEEETETKVY